MSTEQVTIRMQDWVHDEIKAMAKNQNRTFTNIVNFLLEDELNAMGYTRAKYESKKMSLGRQANDNPSQIKKEA